MYQETNSMRTRTKQGLQTLRRAHQFLAGASFESAIGELTPHVDVLGQLVQEMSQHVAEAGHRSQAAHVATDDKRSKGEVLLREYLRPIARLAAILFTADPTARAGFRLPRGRNAEGLLQVADAFIEQCVEHEGRFVAGGLAPDFVQRVRSATAAYRAAITARGLVVGRRVAATAGMEHLLVKAREQLRLIDAMLAPRLTNSPEVLAEWRSVARFPRRVGESEGAGLGRVGAGAGGVGTTGGTGARVATILTVPVAPLGEGSRDGRVAA